MKWTTMWANAQSIIMPQAQRYAKDLTLRYPIYIPFNGNKIKLTLDNFCIDENVKIDSVVISLGNNLCDIQNKEYKYVTFNGNKSVEINKHDYVISDEIDINLFENKFLIVSIYLKDYTNLEGGVYVCGKLSKGYFAYGNQTLNEKLDINTSLETNWVYFLSNIDIYTQDDNFCVACYGDSITAQDWPDYMQLELKKQNINNIAVIRKAVSGTRILREYNCIKYQSYGLNGYHRFMHEIKSINNLKYVIVQQGINDIIHPVGKDINIFRPLEELPSSNELFEGIKYYKECSDKLNLNFIVGTLLPIYNWRTYNNEKEIIKNEFNELLINNYDCIDFNKELGIYDSGVWKFKESLDSGDHLHPSKKAYELMGILAANYIIYKEQK